MDVVYREKAKFDVQNPIIGDLLKEINKGKLTDDEYYKLTKTAPDPKILELQKRFDKFRGIKVKDNLLQNNDDDDDNDDGRSPPGSPNIPRPPPNILIPPLMRDLIPHDYSNPLNLDLNNLENEYDYMEAEPEAREEPIQLDTNLKEIFPDADNVLGDNDYFNNLSSARVLTQPEINEAEIQFFNGGREGANNLLEQLHSNDRIRGNEEFVNFLTTDTCREALQRDNISIHVPTGDIFINNQNTKESIYKFLENQQDETKKDIPLDFSYDDDLNDYMTKYLPSINDYDEVKYDFLSNKNSKFLFNLFNKNQEVRGKAKLPVKHTKISNDDYALRTLQDKNWPYFISRITEFSQGVFDINDIITSDPEEANILNNTRSNFEITKNLYNELLTSVGINLHEFFINLGIEEKHKIDTDLTNNGYYSWNANEVYIQSRILATYRDFFYENGRFPGSLELIRLPTPIMPSFIRSTDWISPRSLYETYVGRDMQGVTSVQFLAAFHRFLGGNVVLSRNAMNEFFHNLSWQALTNDNDSVKIKIDAIADLVKSINFLLQKKIYYSKKKTQEINAKIQNKLLEKEIAQIRTKNEQVEREIVKDILKNNTTDYTPQYTIPTVKTDAESERDKIRENKNYIKTELVKKERDFQTIDDITKKNQKDLIRSVTDPADGILTNENVTSSDWTRSDNNEPVQPQLDPGVINVMQEMVRIMSEQTVVIDSIKNPPQPLVNSSNNPIQITTQPDLQDILTKETPDFTDIIKIKDEITDVISDTNNVVPPNNIVPQIRLDFPLPTGNPEIDQKNLDDYYDTLQQIRPDAFISEDEEDGDDNTPIDGQNTPAINDGIKKETDDVPIFPPDNIVPIRKETDDLPIFPPDNTQIRLDFPLPTGNPEIDQKSLDDYYDILQQIRPDAFISEDEEDDDVIGDNKPIDRQNDEETKYMPYVDSDGNILLKSKKKKKKNIPKIDKWNKIYRDKAKKKAILARIKATRLKNNKSRYKTNVLVPTDTTNDEIGNPKIATIIPPLIKEDIVTDDDVDFKVDVIDSDDDVTYVKYIPPPPEIPVPPPIHPRDRLKQQLTAPKSPEIETFPDDETIDYVPTKEEIDELSDADLSDTETISYLPNYNRRNQIYREKAKKRALKILSRTREKRKNRYKKNTIESKVHVLVPTEVEIKTNNPIDILANLNVTTILPGQLETEDDIIDYKPPVDIPSSDSYVTNHVPLQLDTDKIIMTDDGDIVLTEPDNMQVSEGALAPISNNTLQLESNIDMSQVATRNIVLKGKHPDVSVANIKKTKGDTEISIQHPIFRKMPKQSNLDKKIAKILSQGKPIDSQLYLCCYRRLLLVKTFQQLTLKQCE